MKVILYMAITANGMIAKESDNVDWVSNTSWKSYQNIIKKVGNAIVGRRTYNLIPPEELLDNCLYIILTRNKSLKSSKKNVIFSSKGPKEALKLLENKGFSKACCVGGSKLNASFIKDNLIDEIYVDIEPIVFGKGIPLFAAENFGQQLKLLEVNKLSKNTIQLHYKVGK